MGWDGNPKVGKGGKKMRKGRASVIPWFLLVQFWLVYLYWGGWFFYLGVAMCAYERFVIWVIFEYIIVGQLDHYTMCTRDLSPGLGNIHVSTTGSTRSPSESFCESPVFFGAGSPCFAVWSIRFLPGSLKTNLS
jgi:hypothetical protein